MESPSRTSVSARLIPVLLLFVTFFGYSALRIPVPGVNEPHYLTKARHYWDPEWCAGDLFLESANAHQFYFQTVGWLTTVASFAHAAWIGRALALLLLAIGWNSLFRRLTDQWFAPIGVACVFLLLQSLGNFAGEWLVGGVESKVFAYALAMWSAGRMLDGRLISGGLLLGLSVSLHPVVGAWCGLLGAATWLQQRRATSLLTTLRTNPESRRELLIAAAVTIAAALPGLIPAARVLMESDPAAGLQAGVIQVGIRLGHHLDPLQFPVSAYRYYGLLIFVWWLLRRESPERARWLASFTQFACLLAGVGVLLAAGPRPIDQLPWLRPRLTFLRLYPFRVADLAVPMLVALALVNRVLALPACTSRRWVLGTAAVFAASLLIPGPDQNPSRMSRAERDDWVAACRWIDVNSPRDALVLAPRQQWAVKWYAQRPEYVNLKDCPQDAGGILEWYERQVVYADWRDAAFSDGRIVASELEALHAETGVTHLLVGVTAIADKPAYENQHFQVYQIAR